MHIMTKDGWRLIGGPITATAPAPRNPFPLAREKFERLFDDTDREEFPHLAPDWAAYHAGNGLMPGRVTEI